MEIYFILLIWSIVSASLFLLNNDKKLLNKIYIYLNFVPLIIVSGLRNATIGTDTGSYINVFNTLSYQTNNLWINGIEYGFSYLLKFIYLLWDNEVFFLLCISTIIIGGFGIFIYKNSENVFISTFLFMTTYHYLNSFNLMRQYIAMMLICNGYYFFKQKKIIPYIIIVLVAGSFHSSALIFLFFVLIPRLTIKRFIVLSIILLMLFLFGRVYLEQLLLSTGVYSSYLNTEFTESRSLTAAVILPIFYSINVILLFGATKKVELQREKQALMMLAIFLVAAIIFQLLSFEIFIFSRLTYYFTVYLCLSIPIIVNKYNRIKVIIYILVMFFMSIYYYLMLDRGVNEVTPYMFASFN